VTHTARQLHSRHAPRLIRRPPQASHRALAVLGAFTLGLAAMTAIAPTASATPPPPEPSSYLPVAPPLPPPAVTPPVLPLWVIVAMLACTVVLSVGATLITLSLERARRARNARRAVRWSPDAAPARTSTTAPDPGAAWSVPEILDSDPV
jgi:hypothetical protein